MGLLSESPRGQTSLTAGHWQEIPVCLAVRMLSPLASWTWAGLGVSMTSAEPKALPLGS